MMSKKWVLLTNDDGIEAPGFEMLVKSLNKRGIALIAFAPSTNKSACSMQINLGKPMDLHNREDLVATWKLDQSVGCHLFSLDGTPCDTMIVALDGGLENVIPGIVPSLVVSGVNLGPNLSQDSCHSGTIGAAREAGLYGMPAIACSFTSFELEGMEQGVEGSVQLVERALEVLPIIPENLCRPHIDAEAFHVSKWPSNSEPRESKDAMKMLLHAFQNGELMININVPPTWNSKFQTTRLGMRWYRDAVQFGAEDLDGTVEARFTIGAAYIDTEPVSKGDCDSIADHFASISSLANWPQTHPLALDDELLSHALKQGTDGFPLWLRG